MTTKSRTSEFISAAHPDKACDAISDAVLDRLLDICASRNEPADHCRTAIETLAKEGLVVVSGEYAAPKSVLADFDLDETVNEVWDRLGYGFDCRPTIINYLRPQSAEIAGIVDSAEGRGTGAGDQGIMCGYAHRGGENFMPPEFVAARNLIAALDEARQNGTLPYLRGDAKSQVTLSTSGEVLSVIISTQHHDNVDLDTLRHDLADKIVRPTLGDVPPDRMRLNHKGSFVLGGAAADCGLTGRKIVCDAYGPRSYVGGGAFSGKDPTKVDRSAAYVARLIARTALECQFDDAESVDVQLAFGIGSHQPTAILASLNDGRDITDWVRDRFSDLSPRGIQEQLGLWRREGWRYLDTSAMGHFGRSEFPWEQSLQN